MSDSMLSQDEVDALFKQATGKSIVHALSSAPSEKPVARPSAAPVPPSAPAPVAPASPPAAPRQAAPLTPPPAASVPPPMAKPAFIQEICPKQTVAPPPPASVVSQAHSDAVINQLEDLLSELTARLARAERRLAQLEQGKQADQNMASSRDVARLAAQMDNIKLKLEATPGYNARNLFTCSSCGTSGQLSVPVKCTHCGEEGWWGWWPREKLDE